MLNFFEENENAR